MRDEHRFEFILYNHLRFSRCTPVRLEKAAQKVYRSWLRVRAARINLQRAKRNWYGTLPRPVDPGRPFCFVLRRMKRTWREADRQHDLAGFPAHRTVAATAVRQNWSEVLRAEESARSRRPHEAQPMMHS